MQSSRQAEENKPAQMVLVHGGHFAADCWQLVVAKLGDAVLAVDLPGRGRHRDESLDQMTLERHARSVLRDMDDAGIRRAVLVGHSMGGSVICTVAALAPERVSHLIFVSAPIAPERTSNAEAMTPEVKAMLLSSRDAGIFEQPATPPEIAGPFFCNDMSAEQAAFAAAMAVPDSIAPLLEPVPHQALKAGTPRTFVKLLRDVAFSPDAQNRTIAVLAPVEVIEIDAGHMVMLSQPDALSDVLRNFVA